MTKNKIIRLTESDLHNMIYNVINEITFNDKTYKRITDFNHNRYADDALWDEDGTEDVDRQSIGSEKTSLKQIPYTFRPNKGIIWSKGEHNLDIGGGAYDLGSDELMNREGVINLIFDPYNRNSDFNNATLSKVEEIGGADSVTVNSCLNVIKGRKFIENVIHQAAEALKTNGVAIFKIHPGDTKKDVRKSGDGIPRNTNSGYQQFKRASKYVPLIHQYFEDVWIDNSNDCIVAKTPIKQESNAKFYPDKDGEPRQLNLAR